MPVPCIVCQQPLADHEQQTCTHCVTTVRRNLIDIEQDYAMIAEEILGRAGASTPPDPTGRHGDNEHMLGGDLMVLIGPGSTRPHSDPVEPDSILAFLERWDTDWRITFDMPAAKDPATVARVTLFLLRNLAKAAAELPEEMFVEFHGDVRKMRQWLAAALRNGPQRSQVPCLECGRKMLERPMPREDGKEFEWVCAHCHTAYTWTQYVVAMAQTGQAV